MYESLGQLIRDVVPHPIVRYTMVARVAGVLYITSIVLPFLSDRIAFSAYTSWYNTEPAPLSAPFDADLLILSGFGIAAGPAEAYGDAGGGAEGAAMGVLDFLFVPFFTFTFPILGGLLTLAIPILGVAFLMGHTKHMKYLTIGFFVLYAFYTMLFGMNAATLHARFGLHAVHLATALMMFAVIDRGYGIGLLSDNGYPHPDTAGPRSPQPEPIFTGRRVSTTFSKLSARVPLLPGGRVEPQNAGGGSDTGSTEQDNRVDSGNSSDDGGNNKKSVSYGGSATRREVERR